MEFLADSFVFILITLLMVVGMIGIIVPIMPGIFLVWMGVFVYVYRNGFEVISLPMFLFFTLIVLVSGTSDLWLPYLGARKTGASKRTFVFGLVGSIIGSIILPIIGTIIGYVAGVFVGEYHKRRDWQQAKRAGLGSLAGWGISTAVQLVAGLLIILIFTWKLLAA